MKLIKLNNGKFVIIREANKTDAINMIKYIEKISRESDNLTFGEGEFEVSYEQEEVFIGTLSKQENCLCIIAEDNGKIIGNLTFIGGKRPRTAHKGEFGISVLKDYWGKGLGTELISFLIDWSKETGIIRKIDLRVRTDNTNAIHLYEKMGFTIEGKITRDMRIENKFIDTFQMGLEIG
ncbi:GNAT family N-acetyltransferase [Tissierella creatinini]|nr:GNAT family N-acetyltransferase [Tissierella creatinini]TJX65093.1 GNAT family N-acetyltransferase [Soehngenia saccharolytica]